MTRAVTIPMTRSVALALLLVAVAGCSLFRERSTEEKVAFSRVTPPVAFEMLRDNPGMPVLDLRSRYEFTGPAGHVQGSYNVPFDQLGGLLNDLIPLKDRTFLVYCGHDECGESALESFLVAGYDEVILMEGGLDAWVIGGFGTVTGPPIPMRFDEVRTTEIEVD